MWSTVLLCFHPQCFFLQCCLLVTYSLVGCSLFAVSVKCLMASCLHRFSFDEISRQQGHHLMSLISHFSPGFHREWVSSEAKWQNDCRRNTGGRVCHSNDDISFVTCAFLARSLFSPFRSIPCSFLQHIYCWCCCGVSDEDKIAILDAHTCVRFVTQRRF